LRSSYSLLLHLILSPPASCHLAQSYGLRQDLATELSCSRICLVSWPFRSLSVPGSGLRLSCTPCVSRYSYLPGRVLPIICRSSILEYQPADVLSCKSQSFGRQHNYQPNILIPVTTPDPELAARVAAPPASSSQRRRSYRPLIPPPSVPEQVSRGPFVSSGRSLSKRRKSGPCLPLSLRPIFGKSLLDNTLTI
jgi:hypothetical protein